VDKSQLPLVASYNHNGCKSNPSRQIGSGGLYANIQCGSVSVVQRFGSALNLNVHLHALMMDGVYAIHPKQGRGMHFVRVYFCVRKILRELAGMYTFEIWKKWV
jgi:hypothetical protein